MPEATPNVLRLLRESHEERVLAALRSHGSMSRADLGQHTDLSRSTLYAIIQHLSATGAVVDVPVDADRQPSRRGRPATQVSLNPASGLALGLDLGRRHAHVAVANVAHEIVATANQTYAERTPWSKRLEIGVDLIERVAGDRQVSLQALDGIGVGIVGPVPHARSDGSAARDQRRRRSDLVHDGMAERFGVPVHVDNNTRLAALAEAIWGSGSGVQNVLYLRLSYGVGGGLVLDGHLYAGGSGAAAELGHVCVDPAGPPCPCGGRGCLERYVSVPALLEECGETGPDRLLRRLAEGDTGVRAAFEVAGRRLGQVLAAACNVVNPEVVVVGGELAAAEDHLLGPAREALRAHTHRQVRQDLRLLPASLGEAAAAHGGVAVVLRKSTLLTGYPTQAT